MQIITVSFLAVSAGRDGRAQTETYLGYGGTALMVLDRTPEGISVVRSEIGEIAGRLHKRNRQRIVAAEKDDILTLTLELLSGTMPADRKWREQDKQVYRKSRVEQGAYDKIWDDYQDHIEDPEHGHFMPANVAYMHRVDDGRLVEYFALANDTPTTGQAACAPRLLELGSALAKDHPDDAHVRVVYWDSLLRNGHVEELEKELPQWEKRVASATSKWLAFSFHKVQLELDSLRATARSANAYDMVSGYGDSDLTLPMILKTLPALTKMREYKGRSGTLLNYVPDFFRCQILTKVTGTEAMFLLFQGRTEEAFSQLLGAYRLGQLLNAQGAIVDRLIGISVRSIILQRMQVVTLNACHSAEELKDLLRQFNELESSPPLPVGKPGTEILGIKDTAKTLTEVRTRQGWADARAVLFYAASAARLLQMQTGKLPRTEKELSSVFATGLPRDPFTSAPIRLSIPREGTGITVYSLGPDKEDQQGWLVYDATNGTISPGDVISRVPTKREFPFPRGPVHAYTREDLIAQFPNGLPVDVFANHKMKGLSVSRTTPLKIFSFGPDANEDEANRTDGRYGNDPSSSSPIPPPTKYLPWGPYDPTNGVVSAGDLFVEIPYR